MKTRHTEAGGLPERPLWRVSWRVVAGVAALHGAVLAWMAGVGLREAGTVIPPAKPLIQVALWADATAPPPSPATPVPPSQETTPPAIRSGRGERGLERGSRPASNAPQFAAANGVETPSAPRSPGEPGEPPASSVAASTAEPSRADPLVLPRIDPASGSAPSVRYPPVSRRLGEQGEVLLRLHVREDGRIGDVQVLRSSGHPRLDRAAADAARRWRLLPASRDGVPVALWHEWPVSFRLE